MKSDAKLVLSDKNSPESLIVIPVEQAAIYPTLMAPISISHPKSIRAIEHLIDQDQCAGLLMTKEKSVSETLNIDDLYEHGILIKIIKRIKIPDGSINILVHALKRFRVKGVLSISPYLEIQPEYLNDIEDDSIEVEALSRMVISTVKDLSDANPFFTDELKLALLNAPNMGTICDLVAFALNLEKQDAQELIKTVSVQERFKKLLFFLKKEQDLSLVQKKIQDEVSSKLGKIQRDFFLREQLKSIKKELGEEDLFSKEEDSLKSKIEGLPAAIKKIAEKELKKLESISDHSPEHALIRGYLDTLLQLPWEKVDQEIFDFNLTKKILNQDHYGLEKVKEKVLEFLAVRYLTQNQQEKPKTLLCLIGPPGVGKTSIGKSIARALGRKFFRFSLGGMRDEAEIKGHRRTYIGAMPGKVLQGMARVGVKNPVFLLDEIDKLSQGAQGDPSSALLEVLDPEQNTHFLDHYVDVPFDLSQVFFIATANDKDSIPAPLRDRMEVIELSGYTLEEKVNIAKKHLWKQVLKTSGLSSADLKLSEVALRAIIDGYAREPGVRSLNRMLETCARKRAAQIVSGDLKPKVITPGELQFWLGPQRFSREDKLKNLSPGVITGMAWTPLGGEILYVESAFTPGTGQLKITGQLGEVMSESAKIAWTYVRNRLKREGKINLEDLSKFDIHIHVPSGAVPKDGPSAGVTLATSLYSLMTGRVSKNVAMTGEISLIGRVLPVGGLKEKILAAKRLGIKHVAVPTLNEKDLFEVPNDLKKGLIRISHVDEIIDLALNPARKEHALDFIRH